MSTTRREFVSRRKPTKRFAILVVKVLTWTNTLTSVMPSGTKLKSELKAPAFYTYLGGYP
ncbi:MAG: hypothetical protein HXS48_04630 [Theionarchaea archaeon]|nr:hypothetical protein [Theionarchaea archaeon]